MAEVDFDVVVVGSGSLGSLVALQLARAGKSVVVLEAGPETTDWKVTDNYRNSAFKDNSVALFPNPPYAPGSYSPGYIEPHLQDIKVFPGTLRTVGGTSRHWTAATWRLLPEDMTLKSSFGLAVDWPITYDELEPFYTAAEYEIGVNGMPDFDESGQGLGYTYPPRSKPFPLPPEAKPYGIQRMQQQVASQGYRIDMAPSARISQPYDDRPACVGNNLCNWNCPVGAKHSGYHVVGKIRKLGVEVRSNSVVSRIETDSTGKVAAVHFLSPDGTPSRLTAKVFVLATHGFETPKLLLMNNLAERSGMVGRNLMIHPTIDMTLLSDKPLWMGRGQNLHGAILQRRNQPDRHTIPSTRYDLLNGPKTVSIAANALAKGKIGAELDEEIYDLSSRIFTFEALTEDLPDPANGISLNRSFSDSLGQPGLRLDYKISDYTKANHGRLMGDFANFLKATNGVRIQSPDTWICQHHIMGTVRMGQRAEDAIVDRDLRCFDHQNLFLVTTGVMPTAAGVNPTLTGMALAIRAGQTIAAEV